MSTTNVSGLFGTYMVQKLLSYQVGKDISSCLQQAISRRGLDMRVAALVSTFPFFTSILFIEVLNYCLSMLYIVVFQKLFVQFRNDDCTRTGQLISQLLNSLCTRRVSEVVLCTLRVCLFSK